MDRFVFMLEWQTPVQQLTNEEKGILFQNLINYASGCELDTTNRQVNIAWGFLEPNIQRMNKKYQKDVENGKRGGAPKGTTPWNSGAKGKQTPSEPIANPEQTHSEGKRTYKEKYKEKEKYNKKENEIITTYFSGNSIPNSTHTHAKGLNTIFQPYPEHKQPELILDSLDAKTKKEADRQAEIELEKLLNKNL